MKALSRSLRGVNNDGVHLGERWSVLSIFKKFKTTEQPQTNYYMLLWTKNEFED